MITLGSIPLNGVEDVSAARDKILGLSRALQFDPVRATRIAFAVSEQSRAILKASCGAELSVALEGRDGANDLLLKFRGEQAFACAAGIADFFDATQLASRASRGACELDLRIAAPLVGFGLNEDLLARERARLARKTRTQLIEELKVKNEQLEEYNSQLEAMVAARTAELQNAYLKIKNDLQTAADYVLRLIPSPWKAPLAIDWLYSPSADLGGDIFGYHTLDEEHVALYLLDVTGHGVDSALLAVSIVNVIRSAALPNVDFKRPGRVLEALNNAFPMEQFGDKMFTLWYGVFHTASRTLSWSGAGHPPALLYEGSSTELRRLESGGPMAGMIQDVEFDEESALITAPSRLFVYSDGAHEIQLCDGGIWKFDEFVDYVSSVSRTTDPLADLLAHVRRLHGNDQLDDDFSIMKIDI